MGFSILPQRQRCDWGVIFLGSRWNLRWLPMHSEAFSWGEEETWVPEHLLRVVWKLLPSVTSKILYSFVLWRLVKMSHLSWLRCPVSARFCPISLVLHSNLLQWYLLLFPFSRWGNWDLEIFFFPSQHPQDDIVSWWVNKRCIDSKFAISIPNSGIWGGHFLSTEQGLWHQGKALSVGKMRCGHSRISEEAEQTMPVLGRVEWVPTQTRHPIRAPSPCAHPPSCTLVRGLAWGQKFFK